MKGCNTMKQKTMMVTAFAAAMACVASARTMNVTVNRSAIGLVESFDFTFDDVGASTTNLLCMACGTADGGAESLDGWDTVKVLAEIPGNVTSHSNVPVPSGWGQTVTHVRFFVVSGGSSVPGAYELEYISADGSGQHVMTGFTPNGDSAVVVKLAFNNVSTPQTQGIFCARAAATSKTFTFFWDKGRWRLDYGSQVVLNAQEYNTPGTDIHTVRFDKNGLEIDGNVASGTVPTAATFTAGSALAIFAAHLNNASWSAYGNYKLYSFKAWADGTDSSSLKLDLVPCKKNDGTVCLYDKVGDEFLTNEGSGSFTPGNRILNVAYAVVESASELVSTPMSGWLPSNGTWYPYVNPLYVVDVAEGSTNAIDGVTFKRVEAAGSSVTNLVSYSDFIADNARTGTIVKIGGGTLKFDRDISTFTGPVHVLEGVAIGTCSNCFGRTTVDGAGPNQRTYVHSGATVVMDAIGNMPNKKEANAIYYEGEGAPGVGGAFVVRNGDAIGSDYLRRWQAGSGSQAVGPATFFVDLPSGEKTTLVDSETPKSGFSCAGQDLLIHGRTVDSEFAMNNASLSEIGNLVISNVTLAMMGDSVYLYPKNGNESTIRFRGGARWGWCWSGNTWQSRQTATLYIDDMEYAYFGSSGMANFNGVDPWQASDNKTLNWYRGPMVLNDHFRIYNMLTPRRSNYDRTYGYTFSAKVSGPKGFRPWFTADGAPRGNNTRLNLLYPTNTFEGGIVLESASLGVWAERAVPSHDGAGLVSVTNGYIYFGRQGPLPSTAKWPVFEMPVTEFVGAGAVTNGTGTWKGLVKKGDGTLDYNSQLGGAYLDLQGGIVKFGTQYREEYTGDNAEYAPDGYEAALPAFTTLKGTAGVLDLEGVGGGTYTVANVDGTPSVTNGSLTVTGTWTLDAATLGATTANVSETLAFGPGATLSVTGDLDALPHRSGGFLFAKAENISGAPQVITKGWTVDVRGNELRIVKKNGFMILVK